MLAHAQQAARVVFVQIVHQAQRRVGIGCGAEIVFRKGGLLFIFVKHNRRRLFLTAGADGFGQIDRCFGGFFTNDGQRCLRRQLSRVNAVVTRQTGGIVLNGGALQSRVGIGDRGGSSTDKDKHQGAPTFG